MQSNPEKKLGVWHVFYPEGLDRVEQGQSHEAYLPHVLVAIGYR